MIYDLFHMGPIEQTISSSTEEENEYQKVLGLQGFKFNLLIAEDEINLCNTESSFTCQYQ